MSTINQLNQLLGLNLWDVTSFRADITVNFDEYGNIMSASFKDIAFCDECNGPYTKNAWLMRQYGGHWDTCPNRPKHRAYEQ